MTETDKEVLALFEKAVRHAIKTVGIDGLRKTSLFLSSHRRKAPRH
jgi:hypothetical protein